MKFPRRARLSGAEQFGAVFRKPRVSRDPYFRVLSKANTGAESRLGLAVSRRVCRKAAGRNRLKRIVRESFRTQVVGEAAARDYVVLPLAEAAALSNAELFRSLQEHWRRHGRRKDEETL